MRSYLRFHQTFSDYYNTNDIIDKTKNETISGSGNYYIHDAVFSFHFQSRAITINSDINSNFKILLEECSFYNNSYESGGGSFYISRSDCILNRVCCSFSSVNNEYFAAAYYIQGNYNYLTKNYAFECSISQCQGYYDCISAHSGGDFILSKMNSSFNIARNTAALISDNNNGIINFTTAKNTTSFSQQSIYIYGIINITKCNILNNEIIQEGFILIHGKSHCAYSYCSFINNIASYLFYEKSYNVESCYFHENNITRTVQLAPVSYPSINPLDSFISHYNCSKSNILLYKTLEKSKLKKKIKDFKKIPLNFSVLDFLV